MNSTIQQDQTEKDFDVSGENQGIQLYAGEESLISEMRQEIEQIHDKEDVKIRNPLEILSKQFDLNEFLKDFGKVDCGTEKHLDLDDEECKEFFKTKTFGLLGDSNTQVHDLWKHITENVYKPLAIDFKEYQNISELLSHFYTMSNKSSLLENQPLNVNYKTFENSILSSFLDINGRISDVDANKEAISQLMISILKKCHLYWNSLRTKGQVKKAVEDTKALIQSIAKVHMIRSQILRKITSVLFDKIKLSFKRFQGAHMMLDVIKKKSPQIIGEKMIMRYVNMADHIRRGIWSDYTLNREYNYQGQMMVSFLMLNFYKGHSQPEIENLAHLAIINRIIQSYNEFYTKTKLSKEISQSIQQFTAVLVLKLSHKVHVALKYHPITSYAVASQVDQYMNTDLTVRVMFDFQNQSVLIPKTCASFFKLKDCMMEELNKTLNFLNKKYQLKRSVEGWQFLDYLTGILRQVFQEANDFVWSNFYVFKQYYYQHLFILMSYVFDRFHIEDDRTMDKLEEMIGDVISQSYNQLPNANVKLIDIFDLKLYDQILKLRATFNKNAPYDQDSLILTQIQNDIHKFMNKFKLANKNDINFDFLRFLKKIKETVQDWKVDRLNSAYLPIRQGVFPLNAKELYVRVDHVPKGETQNSETPVETKSDADKPVEENVPKESELHQRKLVTTFDINEALHTADEVSN